MKTYQYLPLAYNVPSENVKPVLTGHRKVLSNIMSSAHVYRALEGLSMSDALKKAWKTHKAVQAMKAQPQQQAQAQARPRISARFF